MLGIIKTWNRVPFNLELNILKNYPDESKYNWSSNIIQDIITKTDLIHNTYPFLNIYDHYEYRNPSNNPILYGETSLRHFKELFGNNIARGISLVLPPTPLAFPLAPILGDFFTEWYKIGDLTVPKILDDFVKNIDIPPPAYGSFFKYDLWLSPKAREFKKKYN